MDNKGQILVEFLISTLFLVGLLVASGKIAWSAWLHAQCTFTAFDQTRAYLDHSPRRRTPLLVSFEESSSWIEGSVTCKEGGVERVRMRKLER